MRVFSGDDEIRTRVHKPLVRGFRYDKRCYFMSTVDSPRLRVLIATIGDTTNFFGKKIGKLGVGLGSQIPPTIPSGPPLALRIKQEPSLVD